MAVFEEKTAIFLYENYFSFQENKGLCYNIIYVTHGRQVSAKDNPSQDKKNALRNSGTLNSSLRKVRDAMFQNNSFFDSMDIVQVKYELLRRVQTDGASVVDAAKNFGFSRLSYYRILAVFNECGLQGLVPRKRGPRKAHKLNDEVFIFIHEQIKHNSSIDLSELKIMIQKKFGLSLHERTIERALSKKKKSVS